MVTPQQLDEMVFPKAVFGGYDMQSVDELLMPLAEDYKTLYKENAVLKSKLRVLVEKLEEYRKQEATMQNAMVAAQQTADRVVQDAERKAAALMNEAEKNAQHTAVMAARTQEIDLETERLNKAKEAASSFIAAMEQELRKMGAELFSTQDTVTVRGGALHGADGLYGHNDHRVVMALAVAAYAAGVPAAIGGAEAVNKSWPYFFETVRALGGKVELTDE